MKKADYILTALAIGIAMGYYYNLDMLQAEQVQLKHHPYFLDSQQFNFLYFCTYLAQFLFLLPLGVLVDRFSLSVILIILISLTLGSQIGLGLLLSWRGDGYLGGMFILRGILGISGLGIVTVQGKLVSRFSKKHYQFIMGLCLNIPYCFNALNSFVTASVQSQTGSMPLCFFIGAAFCALSLLIGIYCVINLLNKAPQEERRQAVGCDWEGVRALRVEFWVLVFSVFVVEGSINSFIDNMSDFFVKSFGMEVETVASMVPILFLLLTPFSLVLGKFVEHFPAQKRNMMIISRLIYLLALIALATLPQTDEPTSFNYVAVITFLTVMSFNWAVFHSILEPCIAYYVPESQLGTAWGIVGSTLGLSQSCFSLVNIAITSSSKSLLKSYEKLLLNYIIVAACAVALALWVRFRDYKPLDEYLQEGEGDDESDSPLPLKPNSH